MTSSSDLADFLAVHTVTVETYEGRSGTGQDVYADAKDINGWLTRKQALVRNADGDQVVAQGRFSADITHAGDLVLGTRVTLPTGETMTVINREVATGGDLIEDIDRVSAYLQ